MQLTSCLVCQSCPAPRTYCCQAICVQGAGGSVLLSVLALRLPPACSVHHAELLLPQSALMMFPMHTTARYKLCRQLQPAYGHRL
jgi:hypothetical protein